MRLAEKHTARNHPSPSSTTVNRKLIRRIIHTSVSLTCLTSIVRLVFVLNDINQDASILLVHRVFKRGVENTPYYFSFWLMAFHLVYFNIYFAIDLLDMYMMPRPHFIKMRKLLHKIASYLLFSIIFPLSTWVCILFWSVYIWDRESIYPRILDVYIPTFLNHVIHTLPVPVSVLFMMTSNKYEPPRRVTLVILLAFLSVYGFFFYHIQSRNHEYLYILFDVLTPTQRNILMLLCFIVPVGLFFVGYELNAKVKNLRQHLAKLEFT